MMFCCLRRIDIVTLLMFFQLDGMIPIKFHPRGIKTALLVIFMFKGILIFKNTISAN